jgi:hypothetical protein
LDFDSHEAVGVLQLQLVDLAQGCGSHWKGVFIKVDENVFNPSAKMNKNKLKWFSLDDRKIMFCS